MKIDPKTILGIALMGGIGFVAWKFYKGDWKLPNLGSAISSVLPSIPGIPKDINITLKEGGVPAATGDIIYNIVSPGNLREETTIPGTPYYEKARREIVNILPPDVVPQHEQIVPRSVAMKVATDIIGRGFIPSMFLAPITIGAGLGAIKQQQKYYESLPVDARAQAVGTEYATREKWISEHPIETAIGFPAVIIHAATKPTDLPEPTGTDFFSTMIRGVTRIREKLDLTPAPVKTVAAVTPAPAPVATPAPAPVPPMAAATMIAPTGLPKTVIQTKIDELLRIRMGM